MLGTCTWRCPTTARAGDWPVAVLTTGECAATDIVADTGAVDVILAMDAGVNWILADT